MNNHHHLTVPANQPVAVDRLVILEATPAEIANNLNLLRANGIHVAALRHLADLDNGRIRVQALLRPRGNTPIIVDVRPVAAGTPAATGQPNPKQRRAALAIVAGITLTVLALTVWTVIEAAAWISHHHHRQIVGIAVLAVILLTLTGTRVARCGGLHCPGCKAGHP